MSSIQTEGTAFPVNTSYPSMTMRDYFAAAALQGMLAATPGTEDYPPRIATSELAYLYADAMLKERERGE